MINRNPRRYLTLALLGFAAMNRGVAATPPAAVGSATIEYGPAAALEFARHYQGERFVPKALYCYPDAVGVPFADCVNIIPMTPVLWTPKEICADFRRRMIDVPAGGRKKGIIVLLKTERCATKWMRACTITTAALEKRSTPLAAEFLIYGAFLKPRDNDEPAGSLKIETGLDAWKNDAAGEYQFIQGPGATLVFLNPTNGARLARTDAYSLQLYEQPFQKSEGRTPELEAKLAEILKRIEES